MSGGIPTKKAKKRMLKEDINSGEQKTLFKESKDEIKLKNDQSK